MPDVRARIDSSHGRHIAATALIALCYGMTAHLGFRLAVVADQMLRAAGGDVATAGSAAEALEAIDAAAPDVLLSDIGMPEADGYALIREVRRRDAVRGRRLPAVALTAYASPRDREQALAAGFDHHLAKPVGQDALIAAVQTLSVRTTP